jgi:hypothetical protein
MGEGNSADLLGIDPGTGEILSRISDLNVCQLTADETALWISDCGSLDLGSTSSTVWRVDPATNRIVASFRVPGAPGLGVGQQGVWVASHADDPSEIRLWTVNTRENRLQGEAVTIPVELTFVFRGLVGPPPVHLAVGEGAVWVSSLASGEIVRVQP